MKDTIHVTLSDMHSGSNHALFLGRQWNGLNTSHYPRSEQIRIRNHWLSFAGKVAAVRKNKAVRLVVNGDCIDGDHHNSGDVCTVNPLEQADINIELLTEFQKLIKWQRGDELYITKGTQVHTGDWEDYIGREMGAQMDGDLHAFDALTLQTNGVIFWFVHHGAVAGGGANEGNTLRNWLKNIYYDALKDQSQIPDVVYSGHVHNPTYSTFTYRQGMQFKNMHGVILPSWQGKTRYAFMRAPVSRSKIGGIWQEVKADGTISVPTFCIM